MLIVQFMNTSHLDIYLLRYISVPNHFVSGYLLFFLFLLTLALYPPLELSANSHANQRGLDEDRLKG